MSDEADLGLFLAIHQRMVALEASLEGISVGEAMAKLLGLPAGETTNRALHLEMSNVEKLAEGYYAELTARHPGTPLAIAFLQGVTYAVAAQQTLAKDK